MIQFKFFNKQSNPIVFNLNVMTDPFSRVPSYNVYIEPYEFHHTMEHSDSIRNIITGVSVLPTQVFNGVILTRRDGSHTEINYNNVRGVNDRNLIFDINDRITLRYKI